MYCCFSFGLNNQDSGNPPISCLSSWRVFWAGCGCCSWSRYGSPTMGFWSNAAGSNALDTDTKAVVIVMKYFSFIIWLYKRKEKRKKKRRSELVLNGNLYLNYAWIQVVICLDHLICTVTLGFDNIHCSNCFFVFNGPYCTRDHR